mmetsp:Transcript_22351/g.55201  ORF Transcript_22351/g.55201 Transcript_22351/m.55201 type:complete len:214 (-) Transcript_22351:760-1401(-)
MAALLPASSRRTLAKLSSWEQRIHVSISEKPCMATSWRTRSLKWFKGCCAPTVVTGGMVRLMLLYPYAMATSSAMSQGWSTSERVGGTSTCSIPSDPSCVRSCMRHSRSAIFCGSSSTPMRLQMYWGSASTTRVMKSGYVFSAPIASTTSTGSTAKGVSLCWLNIVTTVLSTILALLRSVAVHSMKMSRVSREIALCAPLMMGGSDSTVRFAS